jgi:cytochrome P450
VTQSPDPTSPIAAVVHPDPYLYYARLVRNRPLYQDADLGLWIASSAAAVTALLTNPACRVRPPSEPVPQHLVGSPAGELFRRLVRMNDGALHKPCKTALRATLDAMDPPRLALESARWAAQLVSSLGSAPDSASLMAFAFALPVHVVGSLVGFEDSLLPEITALVGRFVACLSPAAMPEQVGHGKAAAALLLELGNALNRPTPPHVDNVFHALGAQCRHHACDDPDVIIANAIGLMTQSYEATAGLITATLLTLARSEPLRGQIRGEPALLAPLIDEVLRFDPPVQNTRRFVAEPAVIQEHQFKSGDAVLLVLAAANRDPASNTDPDRFDLARRNRRNFTFGVGPHACPGQTVATSIAQAAVAAFLESGLDPARLQPNPVYRPSANTRIPILAPRQEGGSP